jgi:type II secretory pathway pseudopilin PulG
LLELLAVVAILGLLSTFVAPNLGVLRERRLNNAGMQLASLLELARQRTVMTGVPHRIWFDLDGAAYRLEWLGGEGIAAGEADAETPLGPPEYDVRGGTPLPLSAPARPDLEFQPVPGNFGRFIYLEQEIFVAGLDTSEGWIEEGVAWIGFDRDGTSAYTEIVMEDGSGGSVVLAVLPLEDSVRFLREEV